MVNSVATDIQNMRKEYESLLLPLILEHPHLFRFANSYIVVTSHRGLIYLLFHSRNTFGQLWNGRSVEGLRN